MSKKVSRPARLVLRPEEKARLRLRARTSRVNNQLHKQERDLDSSQLYNFLQQNASVFELHNETGAPLNDLMKIINRTKLDALVDEKLFELLVNRINGCFFNEDCRVRALSFRIVRSLTTNERRLIFLLQRHIDICLIRALDIDENCEAERLEAIKFIGRLLHLYENSRFKKFFEATELEMSKKVELELNDPLFLFPKSVLKSITAVALRQLPKIIEKRVAKTTDNLSFPALGILLEISASNPELVLECAGTDWIVRALIGVGASNAKLSNLVCRVLTKWLDSPVLREKAELHLVIEQIFAPLIDLGFFAQTGKDSLTSIPSKNMETLDACANVFLAILRSWAGVFACASTSENGGIATSSPLKLLEYLGLGTMINSNLSKIRDLVINICCEFVDLPYASKKFTSWDDAVLVYSQMHLPDPYRCSLRDDFVVAEASSLVSSGLLFCDYVDLLASFRAAATYILINVGLPQSLVRLILARPDDPMSIKATLLLADVLRTSASFLPRDWRLRIISVPTLIQSAAETFVTSSNIVRMVREGKKLTNLYHTFSNSENALLLISRLDQLNNICLSRQNTLENLQNINYFVLAGKQSKRSLRHRADSLQEEPQDLSEMMSNAFYNDNLPNWLQVDRVLQLLERDNCELLKRNKHSEKCHTFFANLLFYFKPSAQKLVTEPFDRLKIRCGCCAFSLVSTLLIEPYYSQMMGDFMTNFRDQLEPNTLHSGVFASKYLNNSGAMYYFSLISAICSTEDGYEFLERMRIFQLFLDLITSQSSIEYVKLVLSCLDYNRNGLARVILETALTTTDEPSRKWATRFLEVIAVLGIVEDFADFGMGLLFRQLADESPKVVRHAVRLLNTWIPKYPQSLKYVKNVRVESLGEAGIFIQTHLFEDEYHVSENQSATLKAIQLWMESFNFRYVETVEENMRLALLNVRRSLSGRFARSSSEKYERYGVPAPVHLLANLAKHATGRQILLKTQVVQQLLTTLKNSTIQPENYSRIKAALFGLAHIAGNMPMEHDSRLMPAETIPIICRFAEECPVLSIRGTAFWAMNIIAGSEFGARAIASMGWEGNRHANVLDEVRSRLENLNTNNISVKETSTIRSLKNPIVANKCTSSESSSSPVRTHQMLGRIHSDSMVPLPQIKELKKATIEICLENLVRPERTFTQESAVTSGFGSAPTEEEAAIPNKEAQQPLLPTVFPNRINAQINPMTTGTPVKLDELDNFSNTSDQTVLRYEVSFKDTGRIIMDKEKLKNPKKLHFSSPFRKQFGALPFEYPNALKVARNIDSDITYSFLTDNERNAICSYRELLTKTGEQNVMPVTISPGPISMPTSNWTFIALPCRVELMCQNIFVRSAANSKTKRADQRMRLNVLNTHIKIRCFHCSRAQNVDPLPDELIQEYKKRRAEVLRMISMLEIRGDALEVHLTKLYRESSIFTHPCMYADILELMAEFNYSVESRKFLHKLFWKAFRPL